MEVTAEQYAAIALADRICQIADPVERLASLEWSNLAALIQASALSATTGAAVLTKIKETPNVPIRENRDHVLAPDRPDVRVVPSEDSVPAVRQLPSPELHRNINRPVAIDTTIRARSRYATSARVRKATVRAAI